MFFCFPFLEVELTFHYLEHHLDCLDILLFLLIPGYSGLISRIESSFNYFCDYNFNTNVNDI